MQGASSGLFRRSLVVKQRLVDSKRRFSGCGQLSYIISFHAGLGEQSIARLDSASSLQSARCSHRSSQCERPQRCRELRADWELQCVIRSARERPRARVPVMCGSWILVSLPVWSLRPERNMAWLPEALADRIHKFPGWAPAHPDTL